MAVADANYCFTIVDIGASDRQSDGGVFKNSLIGQGFEHNLLNVPPPKRIAEDTIELPYVLVGDEAFARTNYMMRPYPRCSNLDRKKKVFNYRLSRARKIVESSFGILTTRWRIYQKPIIASVPTIMKIIQATVCLHNYIMCQEKHRPRSERRYSLIAPEDRLQVSDALKDMTRTGANTYTRNAAHIRDMFATYFTTTGALPWQWDKALRNNF